MVRATALRAPSKCSGPILTIYIKSLPQPCPGMQLIYILRLYNQATLKLFGAVDAIVSKFGPFGQGAPEGMAAASAGSYRAPLGQGRLAAQQTGARVFHTHPYLKLPGSTRYRTLPDGLWFNFSKSCDPYVDIFAIEACASFPEPVGRGRSVLPPALTRCWRSARFIGCFRR